MRVTFGAAWLAGVLALGCGSALALEEDKGEKDRLAACERELCGILVKKEAGGDLQCNLQKTWAGKTIKEGVETKKLTWGFGDVRCTLDLKVSRQEMIDALTKPEYEFKLGANTVRCDVEREKEVMNISVSLSPKFKFKDGLERGPATWMMGSQRCARGPDPVCLLTDLSFAAGCTAGLSLFSPASIRGQI
jgi:hypothetical protein